MPDERVMPASEAIREALDQALAADGRVFLIGEGVADPKGVFGTTAGLVEKYGAERVVEMPLSENGFTGVAIGAALMGQRPVIIHQRVEFALLAMEQMLGTAAKAHYVSAGKHSVPLVIRMIVGRGWGQGPQHSQSLEAMFAAVPGLKVVMPALPADAKGMLLAAIEDDNPVLFIEHRWTHYASGHVPEAATALLDGPKRLRDGDDVTIVGTSYMVLEAMRAAAALKDEGVGADLFDLRVIRPLYMDKIIESVKRTGRLVTVDTGWRSFGIGAEITARVSEACFDEMKAAPRRIGLPEHPTPSSRALAASYYPTSADIAAAAGSLAGLDDGALKRLNESLSNDRRGVPIDIPHPSFKGPF
jgi:pyruvate dehydrogenase E1 component beta subunit